MSVNFKQPYEWKGGTAGDADFILQNGVIYAWSESNVCYEPAWWFSPTVVETELVLALRKERPLPEGGWHSSDIYEALDGRAIGSSS